MPELGRDGKVVSNKMPTGYQLVRWFPEWQGFHFMRVSTDSDWQYIYEWYLWLGFWEVRKWSKLTLKKETSNA